MEECKFYHKASASIPFYELWKSMISILCWIESSTRQLSGRYIKSIGQFIELIQSYSVEGYVTRIYGQRYFVTIENML